MVNPKHDYSSVFSIIGLLIVLGVARGFDALMAYLAKRNAQTFTLPYVIMWSSVIIILFLAAILLLLFWFVVERTSRESWVAIIFLLIGLFFVVSPLLYFIPMFCCLPPQLESLLFPSASFISYTVSAGGFIAIMGLFALILPRGKG
jgi:hypothetical protein